MLQLSNMDVTQWICNSTELANIIRVKNGSSLTAEYISQQFCSLDTETAQSLVEELMLQIDIGNIVEEVGCKFLSDWYMRYSKEG